MGERGHTGCSVGKACAFLALLTFAEALCDPPKPLQYDVRRVPDERTEVCPKEEFGGLPQEPTDWGAETTVYFKNRAPSLVELFWIDASGQENFRDRIAPGEQLAQDTRQGHIFHVRLPKEQGSKLLLRHRTGMKAMTNPMGVSCADHLLSALPLRDFEPSKLRCGYINQGFVNRVGCAVNIWYWNGTGETAVAQLGTRPLSGNGDVNQRGFTHNSEATYLDHTFRVRMPNGMLVQEYVIDRVYIDGCEGIQETPAPLLRSVLVNPLQLLPRDVADETCIATAGDVCEIGSNRQKPMGIPAKMEEQETGHWQQRHPCLLSPCDIGPLELSKKVFVRTRGAEL